ncbi:MAG: EAL domain-containing protein, partial [Gemmatimonadaceae bacterium]|nr:EAL domain-containing protein [Gemmatimonadaceae bacterium]
GVSVPTETFIAFAEGHGLISELTDRMIACVADDLARLSLEGSIHIAINIPAGDMETGRFLPVLEAALARRGVDPSQVWLEATERGFMNADAARRTIERARAAGHMVAIDDFGTGYSSLSMLETLPLDALKIDKSFIDAIGRDAATSVVTPHIIEMAHGLGFAIVAEGIETPAQEAYIRAAGVQFAQGWLYSKALPADAFADYYRRRKTGKPSPFLRVAA